MLCKLHYYKHQLIVIIDLSLDNQNNINWRNGFDKGKNKRFIGKKINKLLRINNKQYFLKNINTRSSKPTSIN